MSTSSNRAWTDAIAVKAGRSVAEVEDFLKRHGIRAMPVLPSPRRMTLRSIRFEGVKVGVLDPGPFAFEWPDLEPGLWVIAGPNNLAGKSSIIEIVKWLLRGHPPGSLQDDVKKWVRAAALVFDIDAERFQVAFEIDAGALSGTLTRAQRDDTEVALARFSGEGEFKEVMSAFMLERFSLERVVSWQESANGGKVVESDWPALSGALSIGTDYSSLLGDTVYQGLGARLLRMYLGLPWIPTLAAATTAKANLAAERDRAARAQSADAARRTQRLAVLNGNLEAVQAKLATVPSTESVLADSRRVSSELGRVYRDTAALEQALAQAQRHEADAEQVHVEDRVELQDLLEAGEASLAFGRLKPTCCPHCEGSIPQSRHRQEREGGGCAVCGGAPPRGDIDREREVELRARVEASSKAATAARRNTRSVADKLAALEAERGQLECEAAELKARTAAGDDWSALKTEEQKLLARIEEAALTVGAEAAGPAAADLAIANACEEETKARASALQSDLLKEVSDGIVALARRFGMEAITEASLKGNATLPLVKGGESTSYSKLTEGEKLRIKVATILSMMSVAERRGVGRHPGVLLIDSPGAQEMAPADLEALLAGLVTLATDLPRVQVILATQNVGAAVRLVAKERVRTALPNGKLW